ncbi:Concanavalin A-like lectin/glucanase, partial [Metarhizium majus ARSEF 297]
MFDLDQQQMVVDRSRSSLRQLDATPADAGNLRLLPGENPQVRIFVDVSAVEIFANDRFALTSPVYPSLETSTAAAYDLNRSDGEKVKFECWQGLKDAWPARGCGCGLLPKPHPLYQKGRA